MLGIVIEGMEDYILSLFDFHVFSFEPSRMFTLTGSSTWCFEICDYKINKVQTSHYYICKGMRLHT